MKFIILSCLLLNALGPRQVKSDCVPLPGKHCCPGNLPCGIHSNVKEHFDETLMDIIIKKMLNASY